MGFTFDLQLFGGGKGSSTTVQAANVPTATPEEKALQQVQLNYAQQSAPTALALQQKGADMLLNNPGVTPVDYTQLANQAVPQAYALQNQASNVGSGFDSLGNQAQSNVAYGQQQYDNLANQNNSNQSTAQNGYSGLTNYSSALSGQNGSTMNDLMNGNVNQNALQAQQYAINRGVTNSLGSLLSDKGANGIINSSITGQGIQGISDSVANTMSQNYMQNLQEQAALQNQNATQQQTGYSNQAANLSGLLGANQQAYSNANDITNNRLNLNQQGLSNQANYLTQKSNSIEQQRGLLTEPMQIANAAQNASIDIPSKLLSVATGQQAPTTNTWQTMSNQRYTMASPEQTIVQQGNGGIASGLLGGLGSYFGSKA